MFLARGVAERLLEVGDEIPEDRGLRKGQHDPVHPVLREEDLDVGGPDCIVRPVTRYEPGVPLLLEFVAKIFGPLVEALLQPILDDPRFIVNLDQGDRWHSGLFADQPQAAIAHKPSVAHGVCL
jgi:hypothetical protein